MKVSAGQGGNPLPVAWWSIDPGDKHVGFAEWRGMTLVTAEELTPGAMAERLRSWGRDDRPAPDLLVIETFALYPDKAMLQTGSTMPTAQMIGALRHEAARHGAAVVMQPAAWKKPGLNALEARKQRLWSDRPDLSIHVQDAELHGHIYMMRRTPPDDLCASIFHTHHK